MTTTALSSPAVRTTVRPASIRSRMARLIVVTALLDLVTVALAATTAIGIKFGYGTWPPTGIEWLTGVPLVDFGWIVPVWMLSLALADAYSRRQFAQGTDEFKCVLRGSVGAAGAIAMLAYLINYDMSRGYFAIAWALGTAGLLLERFAVRAAVTHLRVSRQLLHRVVVVGDALSVAELHSALARQPELGYGVVGACVPEAAPDLPVPVLGDPRHAARLCREHEADTLLIASGSYGSSVDLRQVGWDLEGTDIDLIVVPNLIDVAGPRIHMRPVAGLPFLHVEPPQVARAMRWGKAAFDRIGSLALITALLPVFIAVAVAIKLDGRGPLFYRHRRIGLNGQEFGVWKFRSMSVDADRAHGSLLDAHGADALLFKLADDPRITRVGSFLRRYSLDELPQLLNVLAGQMSLVGPRPQVAAEVASYTDSMHHRLKVRPGLTGLWQVSGRSNLSQPESARLDLYYVENWTMAGDLAILARTVRAVLKHEGAY
ncbi:MULTISPECIES: sugar transferase [unclassified Nocardioides]|uniref:sugar transferase n=1 Tax=unclassified Nocardioides TaxID=2615069 RepID=UPI00070098E9|nr:MULTISPECIES: sugar transferase [unclassified Nocardioides]KRA37432.1 hypothetical protein ASD81_01505 [Nocardioides sp. Root614]KRA91393.1 hypothetical protein ASD84_01770 [Nocardioides sp. Root682]